jgi:uncharacterized DUF497 family protein
MIEIDYHLQKCQSNIKYRGLSFDLAKQFDFDNALIWEDTRHDYGERRLCALGFIEQRLHCVVFTLRDDVFWIISLRKANKREEKRYEKFIT